MTPEMLERDDLSIYVIAGVPRSFKKRLAQVVAEEGEDGDVMLLDPELADWVRIRVQGDKRRDYEQTPASAALWRAYRALSAARYHLQGKPQEERIREVRSAVELLWREVSPTHQKEEEREGEEG